MAAHPPAVHDGARRAEALPGSAGTAPGPAPGPAPGATPGPAGALGPTGTDRGSVPPRRRGAAPWGRSSVPGSRPASPVPSRPGLRLKLAAGSGRAPSGARRRSRQLVLPEPAA